MAQHWNNAVSAVDINGQLVHSENRKFDFYGVYYVARKKENIDIMMDFSNLSLTALAGVMKPFGISNPDGDLNGFLTISGELNNPLMNGELDLKSGSLKVDMLESTFRTEGKVQVLPDAVYMDYQKIYDEQGNEGHFNLTLNHTAFKDIMYEIYLDLSGDNYKRDNYYFQVMNTKKTKGLPIYGKALVQSDISISGFNKNIALESPKLKIVDGSNIFFPVYSDEAEISTDEFMTFIDPYDTLEAVLELEEDIDLNMDLKLEISSGTNLAILFDEFGEDALRTNGVGNFNIKYRYDQLKLSGTYTVAKGNYTVSLGKIAAKPFELRKGGTVTWSGDPYKADVNLQAVYKTTASIKELMNTVGSSSASGNQTVYAIINLKDNLFDPVLSFDIEVPNTDENGRMALERVKATEEELNKQFFSLILFGKFLPIDGSNMADVGTGIVGSTASELISSQISSALSQLSDKYEVQFRYDTDDFTTNNEVAVELSTEFLDGRLKVGGAFGVSHSSMDGGQSNIIGDINVEYMLDKEGHLSIKAYNQSNEFDITETNLGRYTQGISFKFQDDFNSWEDFFLYNAILNLKKDNRNTDDIPEEWKQQILDQIRKDEKSTDSQ